MPPAFPSGSSGLVPEGLYLLSEVQERQGNQPEANLLGYLLPEGPQCYLPQDSYWNLLWEGKDGEP